MLYSPSVMDTYLDILPGGSTSGKTSNPLPPSYRLKFVLLQAGSLGHVAQLVAAIGDEITIGSPVGVGHFVDYADCVMSLCRCLQLRDLHSEPVSEFWLNQSDFSTN